MNIDKIILLEEGRLGTEETIELIQDGIDEGWVWLLQGSYGRMAQHFINEGLCTPAQQTVGVGK